MRELMSRRQKLANARPKCTRKIERITWSRKTFPYIIGWPQWCVAIYTVAVRLPDIQHCADRLTARQISRCHSNSSVQEQSVMRWSVETNVWVIGAFHGQRCPFFVVRSHDRGGRHLTPIRSCENRLRKLARTAEVQCSSKKQRGAKQNFHRDRFLSVQAHLCNTSSKNCC